MPLVITTETRTFSDPEGQIEEQSLSGLALVSILYPLVLAKCDLPGFT